jgi:hypothetical protein
VPSSSAGRSKRFEVSTCVALRKILKKKSPHDYVVTPNLPIPRGKQHLILLAAVFFAIDAFALEPASDRIVVLISVDGLAHYYLDDPKAEMPTIRELAAEGASASDMKCSMPTVTWPNTRHS